MKISFGLLRNTYQGLRSSLRGMGALAIVGLMLYACGVPKGQMRVSGKYANIKQGDFFILSTDGGLTSIDTLHLTEGEFRYTCDLQNEATFRIIYPNQSQLVIWGHGGDDIKIKGDVQDLWHVEVSGNEENELYTQFRQQNTATDTASLRTSASQFIRQHPASKVSQYLLTQYFVNVEGLPSDSAETLYKVIAEALPKDQQVATLGGLIQQRYALCVGEKMPDFDLLTDDSVHHSLSTYKNKMFVLYFWAGWTESSDYLHIELSRLKDDLASPDEGKKVRELELLGYSLDVDTVLYRQSSPKGTNSIPTYFDRQGLNGKLANQLGVRRVPLLVLVGTDGKIKLLARDVKSLRNYLEKN